MTTSQSSLQVKPEADSAPVRPAGPLEDLGGLQRELRSLVYDQFKLLALELRLAAHSLVFMITAAIFIGGLALLTWIGLMSATTLHLIAMGLSPAMALLMVTALTVLLALLLAVFIRIRSRDLGFPATLRTFTSATTAADDRKSAC